MAEYTIKIDVENMTDNDKLLLEKFIDEYPFDARRPMEWLYELKSSNYRINFIYDNEKLDGTDFFLIVYIKKIFCELRQKFPEIRASLECTYDAQEQNLSQKVKDHGGYYDIKLEGGRLYEYDNPIM